MTAMASHVPFGNALRQPSRGSALCQRRALVCRAQARDAERLKAVGVQLLAAGLAATTLVAVPSIADAKVVIEQPKLKRAFQLSGTKAPSPAPTEGSGGSGIQLPSIGLPSISLPSLPVPDLSGLNVSPSDGLDPRTIALPGAILGIGAAAFAALRIDPGFKELMREGLVKNSSSFAGYEEAVDEYAAQAAGAVGKGTRKISKVTNKAKNKAKSGGGLGGLFGKKK